MKRYAVDIVLLPPDDLISKSIELNRKLILKNTPKIKLNRKDCLPHISLSMGVLNESERELFIEKLKIRAQDHKPFSLKSTGIYTVEIPGGEKVAGIAIEKSKELYTLHTDMMEMSEKYLTNNAIIDDVYTPPPAEEVTLHFINNYPDKSAYENFHPHITLGVGEMEDPEFTPEFTVTDLALFHLGNYCTCRKPLAKYKI